MLTHARLTEVLQYHPTSGVFRWRKTLSNRAIKGARAGTADPRGYRGIRIDGVRYWEHRLAWFYVHGAWPHHLLDHKNMKRGKNRLPNLRPATHSLNKANRPKQINNTSGAKGVYWSNKGRIWCAQIGINNQVKYLGSFTSKRKAAAAYATAARAHFGEYART